MIHLKNEHISVAFDRDGRWLRLTDRRRGRELIERPLDWWRIIVDDGVCQERALTAADGAPEVRVDGDTLTIAYDRLGAWPIRATFRFRLVGDAIEAVADVAHDGAPGAFTIAEVQFPLVAGLRSVSGDPARDYLVWPSEGPGVRVAAPLTASLDFLRSSASYQQPDELFTTISLVYPRGGPRGAAMAWTGLFSDNAGLYVGSHDPTDRMTTMSLERTAGEPFLTLGYSRYPFLQAGESWTSPVSVIAVEQGDWHAGARRYRRWAESTWWKPPQPPAWVRHFQGWLRVICLTEYGEELFPFDRVSSLADDVRAGGLETVFLLGWNRGGFSRRWPDYVASERLGGEAGLAEAIAAAHARGARLALFLSYSTIDPSTEWYREIGHTLTQRGPDGTETPFPEVYSGLGTWRRIAVGAKPNVVACPATPAWRTIMRDVGVRLARAGADAVLYDAPGFNSLCFAASHRHARPDEAHLGKAGHFAELRDALRAVRPETALFIENSIDRLHAVSDLAQPCPAPSIDNHFWELYRYTFPELIMTNRELALEETDYQAKINVSLLYGFRFDMSVRRCRATLSDMPRYTAALRQACALREALPDLLFDGLFRDQDGLSLGEGLTGKVYEGARRRGVVVWNRGAQPCRFSVTLDGRAPDAWHALGASAAGPAPAELQAGALGVALFEGGDR